MTKQTVHNRIDEIAAQWVTRCDREILSSSEQAQLDAWLEADPRHLGAWVRANAVFARFDRARALGDNFDPNQFAPAQLMPAMLSRRRFMYWAGTAAAASLAGIAFLNWPQRTITTRIGEVLRVPVEDGSIVTLNSDSGIEIAFGKTRRLVRLLRGEALFEVAHDALRPFVVKAAHASIVATGTRFSVQLAAAAAVEVLVSEGSVELDANSEVPDLRPVTLRANMLATAAPDLEVATRAMAPIEIKRRMAWRDGLISFDGDTLAAAAAQFARYSTQRIIIDEPAIAQRRVVGLYSASDPAGFARSAALSLGLAAYKRGNTIHITQAETPEKQD